MLNLRQQLLYVRPIAGSQPFGKPAVMRDVKNQKIAADATGRPARRCRNRVGAAPDSGIFTRLAGQNTLARMLHAGPSPQQDLRATSGLVGAPLTCLPG